MPTPNETAEEPLLPSPDAGVVPGVIVVWSGGRPRCDAVALRGERVTFGRDAAECDRAYESDPYLSRRHLAITFLANGWIVEDFGSKIGTYVDGVRIDGRRSLDRPAVVRAGHTLLLLARDVSPFLSGAGVRVEEGAVRSPAIDAAIAVAERAAHEGSTLLILGERGTGKDAIARAFHERGPRASSGKLVTLNGANLTGGAHAVVLFGSKRGAFTGAIDQEGLVAQAHRGTLYVDELGSIPLEVQASLLRTFQQKEVHPVGGATRVVDFALCAATNEDLERAVEAGKFRADLLDRLQQRVVRLPPLAERREEIPFLFDLYARVGGERVDIDARTIEEALVRDWPGNVRIVESTAKRCAHEAAAAKRAILPTDLGPRTASSAPRATAPTVAGAARTTAAAGSEPRRSNDPTPEEFLRVYQEHGGDRHAVCAHFGFSKTKFYELRERFGIRRR